MVLFNTGSRTSIQLKQLCRKEQLLTLRQIFPGISYGLLSVRFYKKEGKLYLACNEKKEDIAFGLVRMCVTPYRFSWTIFILGLALSYTEKLLVFRWVQIVLLL